MKPLIENESLVLPPSATSPILNLCAIIITLLFLILICSFWAYETLPVYGVAAVCLVFILTSILFEAVFLRTKQVSITNSGSINRTLVKLVGFYAIIGLLAFIYWIFPEFNKPFYANYFKFINAIFIPWMLLTPFYFYTVDKQLQDPHDEYWHLGKLLIQRNSTDINRVFVTNLVLGWMVKLYFMALMFSYFGESLVNFKNTDFSSVLKHFNYFYEFAFSTIFCLDLLVSTSGYACTLKIIGTHIRSTDKTTAGWLVTVMCYYPFWPFLYDNFFGYNQGYQWGNLFWNNDFLYVLWGTLILLALMCYLSHFVAFGIRFSNLTHRGIITNGPYKYTKHPAYLSKCLAWWLISMPFICAGGWVEGLRLSVLLFFVNVIYFLRARTEEQHLSQDPDYVKYSQYIAAHGMFAKLGRLLRKVDLRKRVYARP